MNGEDINHQINSPNIDEVATNNIHILLDYKNAPQECKIGKSSTINFNK